MIASVLFFLTCVLGKALAVPNLIITEITDPKNKYIGSNNARYVELYSVDGAGQIINDPSLYLIRWTNGNAGPTNTSAISLNGLAVGTDGFLMICTPLAANYSWSGYPVGTCDKVASTGGPADSNGDDQIAIIRGTPGGTITIVDIYGVPGQQGSTTNGHYFSGGRAERLAGKTDPKGVWDPIDWNSVYGNYNATDMTPRKWAGSSSITSSPTKSPVSYPVSSNPISLPTLAPTRGCDSTIQDVTSSLKSVGQIVTICTGFVTAIVYNGFYIQETPMLLSTSSGLFIFTSRGSKPTTVGAGIKLTGTIAVYNGMKELISVNYEILPTYKSFTPVDILMPVSNISVLDSFQGMLVNIVPATSYKVVVSEYFNLDRYGEVVLCAADADIGRLYQYSVSHYPSVSGYSQHLDLLKRSCISTDDNSNVQNPLPILFGGLYRIDTDRYFIRGGDVVTTLRGPLWINTGYSKYYYVATLKNEDLIVDTLSNPRPAPPSFLTGDIKIVSSNLLNYFTTLNVRGANTAEEFQRQAMKTTVALSAMNADVFAFTELENSAGNPAVKDLVSRLNIANPSRLYVATSVLANLDTIGGDQIKVDIVFDQKILELLGLATLTDAQVSPALLGNSTIGCIFCVTRVPIAATLKLKSSGSNVTIVVNHFKSKGDSANIAVGLDRDQLNGASMFNHMRTLTATALLSWLKNNPTGIETDNIVLAGDFNSYDMEDPIMTIIQGGYISVASLFESKPYSYLFDGQFGDLDYVFIKNTSSHRVVGARTWHVNSDEVDALDYNTDYGRDKSLFNGTVPYRYSDHDPIVVKVILSESRPTSSPSAQTTKKPTSKPFVRPSSKPTSKPLVIPSPILQPSRKPSSTPVSVSPECHDNPLAMFTLRNGATRTCVQLASRSSKRRTRICNSVVTNAGKVCPDTCKGYCNNLSF